MTWPIRPMRPEDAPSVAELTTQLGYPADAAVIGNRFAHLRGRPDDEVLVAVGDDDRPIGWIHIARVASLEADAVAVIGGLVVGDGHRDAGIGRDLLAAAEGWAVDHGATEVVVRSRTTRSGAHRFYEREGYRLTKESRVYAKHVGQRPG